MLCRIALWDCFGEKTNFDPVTRTTSRIPFFLLGGGGAGISYLLMQVVVVSERSITFTLHLPFLFPEFLDRVSFI